MRLARLEPSRYPRFWSLFSASMPPDAGDVYAALGVTPEEAERLPQEVGELRQIEEGDAVAGFAWVELRERTLHIHALLLEPEYRGRGLGGRVLAALEDELAGRIDDVELGVLPGNEAARGLYERTGFVEVGERLGFVIMRKRIAAP